MGHLCLQRQTKMKSGEGEKISMTISLYNFWLFVVASHNKSYLLAFVFCLWGKKERKNRLSKVIECNTSPRGQQITQPGCLDHFQRCRFSHIGTLLLFEKIWVDFKPGCACRYNNDLIQTCTNLFKAQMLIEIKWSKYIKDKIYGQTTRFWYPILSSSTDLFSRKSEICSFALRVGRADSFLDFKGFPDFAIRL